jgi:hypothetical protein
MRTHSHSFVSESRRSFIIVGVVAAFAICVVSKGAGPPIREIPNDGWVKIFFETIDRLATEAGENSLREATLPSDWIELRVWFGFGLTGTNSFIVRRQANKWSAFELRENWREKQVERREIRPPAKWESAWTSVCEAGLLTLPDFSTLPPDGVSVNDGSCVVIETLVEGRYRAIMYPNSFAHDHVEARKMESIVAQIRREYLGHEVKLRQRSFLADSEILQLVKTMDAVQFPVSVGDFIKGLPFDLNARDLGSDGTASEDRLVFKEWPLTTLVDQRGYFVLMAVLDSNDPFKDREGLERVRSAGVYFRNWVYGRRDKVEPDSSLSAIRAAAPR